MDEPLDAISTSHEPTPPQHIQFRVDHDVARIVLSRPEAANALSLAALDEIDQAIGSLELNEDVKVVVISGSEQAFSSGLDIAEHTDENVYQLLEAFHQIIRRLMELESVSISVVKGMALGAGCELAASCDFCFAAEGSKLGQPELKAGLFPSVAPVIYPRLVGLHRTYEMILTGRIYEAREAEGIGLITRGVAPDQLDAEVEKWVQFLQTFSTPVLRLARRAISDAVNLPFEEGLRHVEEVYLNQLVSTEDAKEGVRALRERRQPVWKHR
jgi:cyclohexa-1,5-dienecarbonyl-CoA hydratase